MSTPKTVSNRLIRAFFASKLESGEGTLSSDLENGEDVNGAELVDLVSTFHEACKTEGIL